MMKLTYLLGETRASEGPSCIQQQKIDRTKCSHQDHKQLFVIPWGGGGWGLGKSDFGSSIF